jgi:hypothetical protein
MKNILQNLKIKLLFCACISLIAGILLLSIVNLTMISKAKSILFLSRTTRNELQKTLFFKAHENDIKNLDAFIQRKGLKAPLLNKEKVKTALSTHENVHLIEFKALSEHSFELTLEASSDEPIYDFVSQILQKSPAGYFRVDSLLITQNKNVQAIVTLSQLSFIK